MNLIISILIISCVSGINAISRQEVLTRAEFWVKHQVPYSMYTYFQDPSGFNYRSDCSGYVSMAWKLEESLSTVTLPLVAHRINESELQAGDIMCNCGSGTGGADGHVLIFEKWAEVNKSYWSYEQHGPNGSPTSHHIVQYPYHNDHRYKPYRYNKIT